MNKLLIICGPTATGKTGLAITLAKKFHGELISADSRQVYKGVDALTGKERSREIPIWLYDVAQKEFSVAHFTRFAHAAIGDIHKRGKLPIVVGGTGFYIRALTEPVDTISIPPNWKLRRYLSSLSITKLHTLMDVKRLEKMNESDRNNPRRLIRAVEVAAYETIAHAKSPGYDALWIGLTASLPELKRRIETRIKRRFHQAASEVKKDLPPILGAAPLLALKRGGMTKDEAIRTWINAEYHYARRQMTWFRKEKQIYWFDVSTEYVHDVEARVREWYT